MNKKYVICNTFLIFGISFLIHGMYKWFPSVLTTIFPVNESLYEHVKLIFWSSIFGSSLLYAYFKIKRISINNFLLGILLSTTFNIVLYFLIYLPVYYRIGPNMTFTLIWYFISIMISQFINYLIIEKKNMTRYNTISLYILILLGIILTYFTYNPIKSDFFRDPEKNYYGIKR